MDIVNIIATDFSGSTNSENFYHDTALEYLNKFSENYNNIRYLVWNSEVEEITKEKMEEKHKNRDGDGGTYPQVIPEWIKKNYSIDSTTINLVVITDGQIYSIEDCQKENAGINYSKIHFIAIGENLDMSVGAAFFVDAEIEIYKNKSLYKCVSTCEPFDYDQINLENFDEKIVELSDFICAKFMGSDYGRLDEVSKLTNLKNRLTKKVHENKKNNETTKPIENLRKENDLLDFLKKLFDSQDDDLLQKIDNAIFRLCNFLHNKNTNYDFIDINTKVEHRLDHTAETVEEKEPDVSQLPAIEQTFLDKITLEESDKPIVLIYINDLIDLIWVKEKYKHFENIVTCPLFLLFRKELEIVGHAYDVNSYTRLLDAGIKIDPANRQPFFGGIIPFEKADKYNDYIIANTFFRGKKIPNLSYGLLYFTLYKLMENKQWIDKSITNQFKQYAMYRINSHYVKIGLLQTSSRDPIDKFPEHLACYYCLYGSTKLFGEDPKDFGRERLRLYSSVVPFMLDIVQSFGYEIDSEYVKTRSKEIGFIMRLKSETHKSRLYKIMGTIFESRNIGQTQFLVPIFKTGINIPSIMKCLQLKHTDIIPLKYVDKYNFLDYVYLSYRPCGNIEKDIKLCPKTFRPFFVVDINNKKSTYFHNFIKKINCYSIENDKIEIKPYTSERITCTRVISLSKLYISFVHEKKRFPTVEEFAESIYNKLYLYEDKVRLFPDNICDHIQYIWSLYEQLKPDITLKEFLDKTHKSFRAVDRIKIEINESNQNSIDDLLKLRDDILIKQEK